MLPKDFYDGVEKPGTLEYVLYSDTDSLFLVIPGNNIKELSTEERMKIADNVAEGINKAISNYLNGVILPRSNISSSNNKTYFKSEMLMESIMFLDVKKNYAYKILAKEGKIFEKPKVKYTGIAVVKSDAAKMTQDILREMIDDIMLNADLEGTRSQAMSKLVEKYYNNFIVHCNNFEVSEIGFPAKWGKKIQIINGMTLYNTIIGEEIFQMGSAGKFFYCSFRNPRLFGSKFDAKTNGIVVPNVFDKELVKAKFAQFQIEIDRKLQWEKIMTQTTDRIIALSKMK